MDDWITDSVARGTPRCRVAQRRRVRRQKALVLPSNASARPDRQRFSASRQEVSGCVPYTARPGARDALERSDHSAASSLITWIWIGFASSTKEQPAGSAGRSSAIGSSRQARGSTQLQSTRLAAEVGVISVALPSVAASTEDLKIVGVVRPAF